MIYISKSGSQFLRNVPSCKVRYTCSVNPGMLGSERMGMGCVGEGSAGA